MIPNPFLGKFIVFEGPDGCGKTTQLVKTYDWLYGLKLSVVKTKEPNKSGFWGSRIYEELAKPDGLHQTDPFEFQKWYACDSKINLRENVIPRLRAGCIVLSDRYRPSLCYSAKNLAEILALMEMNEKIIGEDFIWPDAVLIFVVSVKTTMKRLKEKGAVLDNHERIEVQKRVGKNYPKFAVNFSNCHLIDGEESVENVFRAVKTILSRILNVQV